MKRHPPGTLMHFIFDRYLLLPLGALIALVWANSGGESYFVFSRRLSFLVNEIGMALFLGLVTQEIMEATLPGGALHTWRRWLLPMIAAVGGILGSAVTYVIYVNLQYEQVLTQGWPVVTAIDIAAGYFMLKLIFRRGSPAFPFLLLVAIITNGFALTMLAFRYDMARVRPGAAALVVAAIAVAFLFRSMKMRAFWPYLAVCAPLSWFGFYLDGLHPALSLVPIVPFLPHRARDLRLLEDATIDVHDSTRHFEHEWGYVVQPIVFLFGLVNAGVVLSGYGTGTWASMAAELAGRPAGILLAVGVATMTGFHLPAHLHWRELTIAALATSAGFTMGLFAATAVFPIGPLLAELKLGALLTAAAAPVALGGAWLLHVGRFEAHHRPHRHPRLQHAGVTIFVLMFLTAGVALFV